MQSLTPSQTSKLNLKLLENLAQEDFRCPAIQETEPEFTSVVLRPWLYSWVSSVRHSGLYVRGDGGASITPLVWRSISIRPDLAVVEGQNRHLAIEVKILTESDPGGALTKAVGQATLYQQFGYAFSHALVFDLRKVNIAKTRLSMSDHVRLSASTSLLYYS